MSRSLQMVACLSVVALGLQAGSCFAAGGLVKVSASDESHEQSWNREQKSINKQDAWSVIQQKEQARAEQRQDRMAASAWYGMSASRPAVTSTPFSSRYGSVWEMPGGRPYSWTPAWSRPNYVFFW